MWLNVFSAKKEYMVRWDGRRCTKEDVELPVDVITGSSRFLAGQVCTKAPVAEGLIGYECQGFDRYERRHDGFGNITVDRIEENSLLCGYMPIIITGSAAFSQRQCVKVDSSVPVQGMILGTMCRGFDLYNVVADGIGGSSEVLVQPNSTSCGYNPNVVLVYLDNFVYDPVAKDWTFDLVRTRDAGNIPIVLNSIATYPNGAALGNTFPVFTTGVLRIPFSLKSHINRPDAVLVNYAPYQYILDISTSSLPSPYQISVARIEKP